MRTSTVVASAALVAALPALGAPIVARQSQEDVDSVAKSLIDILFSNNQARQLASPITAGGFLASFLPLQGANLPPPPSFLQARQSQEDVDAVAKSLIDILFSSNQARSVEARQSQEDVDAVSKSLIDILFSSNQARQLGGPLQAGGPFASFLPLQGAGLPAPLIPSSLGARQSQEDVDSVAKSLIDILFSSNQAREIDLPANNLVGGGLGGFGGDFPNPFVTGLTARQSQEDVDSVAKSLIDILFSSNQAREIDLFANNLVDGGRGEFGGEFTNPFVPGLAARQSQEDVDAVAKSLIDILFSSNQARSVEARQSQEDVDSVAKSLIDILFSSNQARQLESLGGLQDLSNLQDPSNVGPIAPARNIFRGGNGVEARQSQEDVDSVAKSLIDILFSSNQARSGKSLNELD